MDVSSENVSRPLVKLWHRRVSVEQAYVEHVLGARFPIVGRVVHNELEQVLIRAGALSRG